MFARVLAIGLFLAAAVGMLAVTDSAGAADDAAKKAKKAAAQKKRGKTLARHQAARSPGALLAYDLVCRRVERELRPDPEAGRGLVWRRRHTSVIGIAVKPLDDAGRLPRSSDASHP